MKLQFRVLQGGVESTEPRTFNVAEPDAMTVLDLKRECFEKEVVLENRKVRLIYMGRMLGDSQKLSNCGLGQQAILHAVVNATPEEPAVAANGGCAAEVTAPSSPVKSEDCDAESSFMKRHFMQVVLPVIGILLFFISTGTVLQMGLRKSPPVAGLMSTQTLFIGCAIWVYLLLCHGLPGLARAISPNAGLTALSGQ